MSAALEYWRERLENVCPYADDKWLTAPHGVLYVGVDRPRWPQAVNTVALYSDFLVWWHNRYVLPLAEGSSLPRVPHRRAFFATLRDLLHPDGKPTRQRLVEVPRIYQGTTFLEKKYQRFIFLLPWAEHVKAFEILTKTQLKLSRKVAA